MVEIPLLSFAGRGLRGQRTMPSGLVLDANLDVVSFQVQVVECNPIHASRAVPQLGVAGNLATFTTAYGSNSLILNKDYCYVILRK